MSQTKPNGDIVNMATLATAQATTSGNSKVFGSIPSWVKKITVMLSGVSLTNVGYIKLELGDSGGLETSGYAGSVSTITHNTTPSVLDLSSSFIAAITGSTSSVVSGVLTLTLLDASTFTWVCHGSSSRAAETIIHTVSGVKSLSAALTQVALTTSDTFDAGLINVMYE